MKASLEAIPKYRITFSRTNLADDPAPDNLGLERQDDGGWHLWSESEEYSGIIIPAEAVEHLVTLLSRVGLGARSISTPILDPAPEPRPPSGGRWSYSMYRATLYRDGVRFAMVTPDGSNALSPEAANELEVALNGKGVDVPEPPKVRIEPDPGCRIVPDGEPAAPGDLWKYPDGRTIPATPGLSVQSTAADLAILQRREPAISPDPGYRIVVPGEVIQPGDVWKHADGFTLEAGFSVGQKLDSDNSAILQRLDPDAVAPGHNPDRLTVAQVGIADGWRLLTGEEAENHSGQVVSPTEYWSRASHSWNGAVNAWGVCTTDTLRTKAEKLEVVP